MLAEDAECSSSGGSPSLSGTSTHALTNFSSFVAMKYETPRPFLAAMKNMLWDTLGEASAGPKMGFFAHQLRVIPELSISNSLSEGLN